MRSFEEISYKGTNFRVFAQDLLLVKNEIVKLRNELEEYIKIHPEFLSSYVPVQLKKNAPETAIRMSKAAELTGLGPMAAVAGTMAQMVAEKALENPLADEVIIENGGDLYISSNREVVIGLYAGTSPISGKIAFKTENTSQAIAICSSSSNMGHSESFGDCDLATVVSCNASLADSAATLAGNLVKKEEDINPTLQKVLSIEGITGVLIVKNDKIGMAGELPSLIKHGDQSFNLKITRDKHSGILL